MGLTPDSGAWGGCEADNFAAASAFFFAANSGMGLGVFLRTRSFASLIFSSAVLRRMISRIVIAGSSAKDAVASNTSLLLLSPTRPPRVEPAERTHLCAGIAIGGGDGETSANPTGEPIPATTGLPGCVANGCGGCGGCGVSFASSLATAGTNCFAARLGAGERKPNGVAARGGTAPTPGEPTGRFPAEPLASVAFPPASAVARAVLNRLADPAGDAAVAPASRLFFLVSPAFSVTLRPNLELGLAGVVVVVVAASPVVGSARFASLAAASSTAGSAGSLAPLFALPPVVDGTNLDLDADFFTFGANALSRRPGRVVCGESLGASLAFDDMFLSRARPSIRPSPRRLSRPPVARSRGTLGVVFARPRPRRVRLCRSRPREIHPFRSAPRMDARTHARTPSRVRARGSTDGS